MTNIMLGMGLAMDAFSVSVANGLNEPNMKRRKMCAVAGVFAFFQALMPMTGWVCVHTIVRYFRSFEKMIPWIALFLLSAIGGKMLYEGFQNKEEADKKAGVGFGALLLQGIATSIDALSAGFALVDYNLPAALLAALIIAAVTFFICTVGLYLGRRAGTHLTDKADILGGTILILIGLEIFISSWF